MNHATAHARILLVEDNDAIRLMTTDILSDEGYTVVAAEAVSYTHLTLPTICSV